MIGSINNVNTLKSVNSLKNNNVSFGKKKAYTTTTTVTEGQPKEKKGFFKKIGLAIVGFFGALFAIGAITDKAKAKKAEGEKPAEDKKPEVAEEKPVEGVETAPSATVEEEVTGEEAPETAPAAVVETAEETTEEKPAEPAEVAPAATVEEGVAEEAMPAEDVQVEAGLSEEEIAAELKAREEEKLAKERSAELSQAAMDAKHGIGHEFKSAEESAQFFAEQEEVEAEVAPEVAPQAAEETFIEDAPKTSVVDKVDSKAQAQALLNAGMAGAMAQALPATVDEVSAVEYADAQKAQLGIATPAKATAAPKAEVKTGNDGFEFDPEMETQMLEDAFEVSLKGEETASDIKATLKEYRQYVKEADRNDFGDIQTKDGGIVAFEKRVEYPEGEKTGIVDEAITKHTREKEKQEILTVTKLDAQGNIEGTATYVNGRIDSLTQIKNGAMNTIQADDKGVLLAKGMKQTETGFAFDEIMNFDYVGDVRRLVSCAKGVKIENGITKIEKAYKFDNDNNLKEFAKEVTIGADDNATLAHDFKFESDNLVAAASLYNGEISAFGKGIAADVFTFENGEIISHDEMCEYIVNA